MLAEVSSLDDDRDLRKVASSNDLLVTRGGDINHRSSGLVAVLELLVGLLGEKGPELVHVDGLAPLSVLVLSEDSDSALTESTRVTSK